MTRDPTPDTVATALDFASVLDDLGIAYVVGGSMASSFHGEPRSTRDVDFVVDLSPPHVGPLVQRLQAEFYVDAGTAREAVRAGGSFNAIHLQRAVKIDVFVAASDAFDLERIRRGRAAQIGPDPRDTLRVDTAEHTIVRKLEWYRRGGEVSDRQWRDAASILAAQGSHLDREAMQAWAERLGVADLLKRLFEQR